MINSKHTCFVLVTEFYIISKLEIDIKITKDIVITRLLAQLNLSYIPPRSKISDRFEMVCYNDYRVSNYSLFAFDNYVERNSPLACCLNRIGKDLTP